MATFQIFDARRDSGNRFVEQQRLAFSECVDWLRSKGVEVERIDLSQDGKVEQYPAIESMIENSGDQALPVVVLDGKIVVAGRYPSRSELSAMAKLQHPLFTFEDSGGCSGISCG